MKLYQFTHKWMSICSCIMESFMRNVLSRNEEFAQTSIFLLITYHSIMGEIYMQYFNCQGSDASGFTE
jgi:hypothetical protein